jgi:hypothetical protein
MRRDEEKSDDVSELLQEAYPIPGPPQPFADRLQQRLLATMPQADLRPQPAGRWHRIAPRIGGLTMRQRIGVGVSSVFAAAVIGFLLLWVGSAVPSASAMEKMAESIRKVKSFKATMITEIRYSDESGNAQIKQTITGTVYYVAPGSFRIDFKSVPSSNVKRDAALHKNVKPRPQPEPNVQGESFPGEADCTQIDFVGKPGISIDHKAKTFVRQPAQQGIAMFPEMIEKLGQFAGQADRELGVKDICGKKARGFEIDIKKIWMFPDGPDARPKGVAEIWIDPESSLPVLFQLNNRSPKRKAPEPLFSRMQDFRWDIALDPKLFESTPPDGYKDNTPRPPEPEADLALKDRVRRIAEGLRIFAHGPDDTVRPNGTKGELFSGRYPKLATVTRAGQKMQWIDKSGKVKTTHFGLPEIAHILQNNPDAAYYGETVKPSDKDKVLLRWQLDDGRYEVIFGDLRDETVTAERLRALEAK